MKWPTQVLIVDDRDAIRQTIRNILFGYECTFDEAGTGAAALELIAENRFDVVFLDVKLPDISGIDVLREARKRKYALGPVVVLTGLPESATQGAANQLGAFRYLTKNPINRAEIRAAFADAVPEAFAVSPAIELPEQIDKPVAVPPASRAPKPQLPRLLVLDDNQNWLDIMRNVLGSDFDLLLTTSAKEAIRHVRKDAFELVVLDMKLPRETGLDVLSRMRKSAPDLRAIILSEHADLSKATESGRRGALDYLKKDEKTLAARVKRILRKNPRRMHVFLSYENRDQKKVKYYYWRLLKRGFLPWMDDVNLIRGKKWDPQIREAIDRADRFVYFLSRHSVNREGVMRSEVNRALRRHESLLRNSTFFIPARLEDCDLEDDLQEFQTVDLFKRDGFTRLLEALTPTDHG